MMCFCFTSNQDNATPLYMASHEGHDDVVKTLLGAGTDVKISTSDVSDVRFMHALLLHVHVLESVQ